MSGAHQEPRRPLAFFGLVFALSIPFWVAGAVVPFQLLPGLPVSALMLFGPPVAASMLVYREDRAAGVFALVRRAFDYRGIRGIWYLPIVLLMPSVTVMSYGLMRLMRVPLPDPKIPVLGGTVLFLALFVSAAAEEVGWSGYATDPLQQRWGALQAAIILGLVWAAWHAIPLIQADRGAGWIAWWTLGTVCSRILDRLALQQHGEQCLCREPVSRNAQSLLAIVP